MKNSIFCIILVVSLLFIIPNVGLSETVIIEDTSPEVHNFYFTGDYFVNVIADPITYNVSGDVIILSEFKIDVYNKTSLVKLQSFKVSGMYQDLFVHDASIDYAVISASNFTNPADLIILDTSGNNLLNQSDLDTMDVFSYSAKIFDDTIELYQLHDLGHPFIMKVSIFDIATQEITKTFEIPYPESSDEVRKQSYSYPIKLSDEEYLVRHSQTEYISSPNTQKLTAFSILYNVTSDQTSVSKFSSGICDTSFEDKSGQLRSRSSAQDCQFFVDYLQEEIYFARIMELESRESVLHMTWENKELRVRLNYSIHRLDPYLPVYGKDKSLQILSFDYHEWRSDNNIHYLNLKFDFENEEVYISEGLEEVPTYSDEFIYFYTDNFTSATFYFPTVLRIAEIKIDNILPELYVVPSDIYRQSQYSDQPSVNFLGFVIAIPVAVVLKGIITKSKRIF